MGWFILCVKKDNVSDGMGEEGTHIIECMRESPPFQGWDRHR